MVWRLGLVGVQYISFFISNRYSSHIILALVFREIEAGISRIEGHPQPHNEFEATLGYIRRPCLQQRHPDSWWHSAQRLELSSASFFFSMSIDLKGKAERVEVLIGDGVGGSYDRNEKNCLLTHLCVRQLTFTLTLNC